MLQVVHEQLLVLALVVYAQVQHALGLAAGGARAGRDGRYDYCGAALSPARVQGGARAGRDGRCDPVRDGRIVPAHLLEGRPRDRPPAGLVHGLAELLVVRVEVPCKIGRVRPVGRVDLSEHDLEYPADVAYVPLWRARVGGSLHDIVVGRERRDEPERPVARGPKLGGQPPAGIPGGAASVAPRPAGPSETIDSDDSPTSASPLCLSHSIPRRVWSGDSPAAPARSASPMPLSAPSRASMAARSISWSTLCTARPLGNSY